MRFPQGIVRLVGRAGTIVAGFERQNVAIADLGAFFRVLGPDDARLRWQDKYGFGTLGTDGSGAYLYNTFPVLSRTGWMDIDEVVVEGPDLVVLSEEAERAAGIAHGAVEQDLFTRIALIEQQAIEHQIMLEFGHP
jgi:hypothetical protein